MTTMYTTEQLTTLYNLGRGAGHYWATTLTLEKALELGTRDAILAHVNNLSKDDPPYYGGINAPPKDGHHYFPSRGEYWVDANGDFTIHITRPMPGRQAHETVVLSVNSHRGGTEDDISIPLEAIGHESCRSWHLLFVADLIKYACPKLEVLLLAKATDAQNSEDLRVRQLDAVSLTTETLRIATEKHAEAVADLEHVSNIPTPPRGALWLHRLTTMPAFAPITLPPPPPPPVPAWQLDRLYTGTEQKEEK